MLISFESLIDFFLKLLGITSVIIALFREILGKKVLLTVSINYIQVSVFIQRFVSEF